VLALYNTLAWVAKPFVFAWAAWHGRDPARAREFAQRTARELPDPLRRSLWLHGASVGEARLVSALSGPLREAFPRCPQAVSANTSTGLARLPEVEARFIVPFDFAGFPTRVLKRLDPRLLVLIETELWPNLIRETSAAGVPLALVNARLAAAKMSRYRRFSALYRPLIERFDLIGAQSADDAERFASLGASTGSLTVTGNLKYDLAAPHVDRAALEARIGISPDRQVWVAGSTRPGEEAIVLEAFGVLRRSFPELVLVLAPRHLERIEDVRALVRAAGWEPLSWSLLESDRSSKRDVVLIDTLGELATLYGVARVAFVGGSLKPFGGHSPLEPAAAEVPLMFGPHTDHFAEPARELLEAGGARRVTDASNLSATASVWLADRGLRDRAGEAAGNVVRAHSGALRRTIDLLAPVIERGMP